jgi:ankyrin repeat protein
MFMEMLKFDEIDDRHDNIKIHGKTCLWLLQRTEYLDWRDETKFSEHQGFLWIKGKAGTGKSTMMKYAYAHSRKELQDEIVISYFFNARGAVLERSMDGMFRSLLYQTFERLTNPESVFEILQLHGHKLRTLNLEILKEIFKLVVENLGQQHLTCFIDALDETNVEDVQEMIAFFEVLGQSAALANVKFHVCFSSRHYPEVSIKQCRKLVLEERYEHHANIEKYIKRELAIGHSKLAEEIRAEVQRRASGIFLWVLLVVDILNDAYRRGRIHSLRNRLSDLPDKLEDLFRMLILRDTRNTAELVLTLQWILFAKRPLKREELYFAIRGGDQSVAIPWNQDEITLQDMERFILDCSKGLVEVTRGAKTTVQLIHESVRTFLLQETGLPELERRLVGNIAGSSHDDLKRCCQNCLRVRLPEQLTRPLAKVEPHQIEEFRREMSNMYPFLQYAVSALLHHANIAQCHGIAQQSFVEELALGNWIALHNLFEKAKIRQHSFKTTKAYVFADQGATHLLEVEIEGNLNFNAETEGSFRTPIGVAVSRGNERDVEVLLRKGGDPMSKATRDTTALELATKKGYTDIVRTLLEHGAKPEPNSKLEGRLLQSAIKGGRIDILKALLDHGINVNARWEPAPIWRERGWVETALQVACATGRTDIVELLISRGAEINCEPDGYGSPLHAASCNGHLDVVQLLLDHHANCNAGGDCFSTPLHVASFTGDVRLVRLLIERGEEIDINAKNFHLGTPLCIASEAGDKNIVELLLSSGADANVLDGPFGTPLQAASYKGFVDIVELLLKHSADVNVVGGDYDTALRAASFRGHEKVVEMLLRNKADVNLRCSPPWSVMAGRDGLPPIGKWLRSRLWRLDDQSESSRYQEAFATALEEASSTGRDKAVEVLLRWAADTNARSNWHNTAQSVVLEGSENQPDLLSSYDADSRAIMLYEAALRGRHDAIERMLRQDIELNIQPESYEMALHVAIDQGHEKVIQLLLDHGVQERLKKDAEGSHREIIDLTGDDEF